MPRLRKAVSITIRAGTLAMRQGQRSPASRHSLAGAQSIGQNRRMDTCELDNPFWSSLVGRHRALAQRLGDVARYPADFAPFVGVRNGDVDAAEALASLVAPGETLLLLGIAPRVDGGWRLDPFADLAQMTCDEPIAVIDGPEAILLTDAHRADVLALTALVYPHYFRPRTIELGRYYGIYEDGRLAAMAGERLGMDGHQEISAICTHPDFSGRGHARRLTAILSNDNLARGRTPFLHVSRDNVRAMRLYERIGYRCRREIGFWSLRRL
jgi:GNAT superfamily N-acetyltransferase